MYNTKYFRYGFLSTLLLLALSLLGCASHRGSEITECYYPDSPKEEAPIWVCSERFDGYKATAVGSYAKSKAGYQFMEQQATASARLKLAQQVRTQVRSAIEQFASTTGSGESEVVEKTASSLISEITKESLRGTRIIRKATSESGYLYVLVGMDKRFYIKSLETAVQKSQRKDGQLWDRFGKETSQNAEEAGKQVVEKAAETPPVDEGKILSR